MSIRSGKMKKVDFEKESVICFGGGRMGGGLFILGVGWADGREGGRLFSGDGKMGMGGVWQKNLQILDL